MPDTTIQSEITEDEDMADITDVVLPTPASKLDDTDETLTDNDTPDPKPMKINNGKVASTASTTLEIEDSKDDLRCEWINCMTTCHTSEDLVLHIQKNHLDSVQNITKCHWHDCHFTTNNKLSLIIHIRSHSNYEPYYCQETTCPLQFTNPQDLVQHMQSVHNEKSYEHVAWISYLVENKNYDTHLQRNEARSSASLSQMYHACQTNNQFVERLGPHKIDFIKIQNVSVDDIVAEPVKKKGRTANSEINVKLRSMFKEKNDKFRASISKQSLEAYKTLKKASIEELPADAQIDEMTAEDLTALLESLNRKYLWSLEVNHLMEKEYNQLLEDERKISKQKEALLDSLISMEIPKKEQNLYR